MFIIHSMMRIIQCLFVMTPLSQLPPSCFLIKVYWILYFEFKNLKGDQYYLFWFSLSILAKIQLFKP